MVGLDGEKAVRAKKVNFISPERSPSLSSNPKILDNYLIFRVFPTKNSFKWM